MQYLPPRRFVVFILSCFHFATNVMSHNGRINVARGEACGRFSAQDPQPPCVGIVRSVGTFDTMLHQVLYLLGSLRYWQLERSGDVLLLFVRTQAFTVFTAVYVHFPLFLLCFISK